MPTSLLPPRRAAFLLCLALTLAACAVVSPDLGGATPTALVATQPPVIPTVETLPTVTATISSNPPATLTKAVPTEQPAAPRAIGFVGRVSSAPPGSLVALSLQGAQAAAAAHSSTLDVVDLDAVDAADPPAAALQQAADRGPAVLIAAGSELADAAREAARTYPAIKFIGVDQPAVDSLANYFTLGEPGNRPDEEAFLAGALGGLVTRKRELGLVIIGETLEGRLYKNGYLHGMRYTCGDCVLTTIELADPNDLETGKGTANRLKNADVDVMFAAAGPAGEAGLDAAAAQELWVIGLASDRAAAAPSEFVLGSVLRRPDQALPAVIEALLANQSPPHIPFALANNTLSFAAFGPDASPAIQGVMSDTVSRLASGALDTGVELTTGEEK